MIEQNYCDYEKDIMSLIVNSGEAKSIAIEALRYGRKNEFTKAFEKIKYADRVLMKAHKVQTQLIQNEINGKKIEVNLLMIHAQDHLMNSITVLDLVKEIVGILEKGRV